MKRNLDAQLLNLADQPFEPACDLLFVCSSAALGQLTGDETLSIDRKLALYNLGKKMRHGGVVDFTAEEISLLKDRIGRMFPVQLIGRAFEHLETDLADTPAQ